MVKKASESASPIQLSRDRKTGRFLSSHATEKTTGQERREAKRDTGQSRTQSNGSRRTSTSSSENAQLRKQSRSG